VTRQRAHWLRRDEAGGLAARVEQSRRLLMRTHQMTVQPYALC
jgi:hypothetical protein